MSAELIARLRANGERVRATLRIGESLHVSIAVIPGQEAVEIAADCDLAADHLSRLALAERGEGFLSDMEAELARAEAGHAGMANAHEAYAVILEELDEFKAWVWMKQSKRDHAAMRTELLQIATMAWRTARDLGYEVL